AVLGLAAPEREDSRAEAEREPLYPDAYRLCHQEVPQLVDENEGTQRHHRADHAVEGPAHERGAERAVGEERAPRRERQRPGPAPPAGPHQPRTDPAGTPPSKASVDRRTSPSSARHASRSSAAAPA